MGRVKTAKYFKNDSSQQVYRILSYTYTGDGQLYRITDSKTGYTYIYNYDSVGRLNTSTVKNSSGTTLLQTRQVYNANDQLTAQQWIIDGTTYSQTFSYSKTKGTLTSMTPGNGDTLSLTYDTLQRLSKVDTGLLDRYYTYRDISDTQTTTQVAGLTYDLSTDITYGYTYDQFGNIATYTEGDTTYTYTYDVQNQLLSQSGGGITYTYTYDGVGNIRSAVATDGTEANTISHSYSYGDSTWQDLLTAFDKQPITYDASGNPLSYYNGTRWSFTWEEGRRLVSASGDGKNLAFTYDSDGLRLTKTVNGVTHNYLYASGKLLRETWGDNTLDFFYDESGHPYAVTYTTSESSNTYYYVTNLQGDVLKILYKDENDVLQVAASYSYDPYGKPTIVSDTSTDSIGAINPLRYRGYVYDTETGLYYLQSRYYDPTTCRFINADSYASTGQGILGCNMFAYCGNNPINCIDQTGCRSVCVIYPYYEDPAAEVGKWLGKLISDWIEGITVSDKKKIQSGEVSYVAGDNGAYIENSHKIKTPWVMYSFVKENRGTEMLGTTSGAVWEWCVHNIAYDIFSFLGEEQRTNQAAHLNLGATIYDDNHGAFSYAMFASYYLVSSLTAIIDAITQAKR